MDVLDSKVISTSPSRLDLLSYRYCGHDTSISLNRDRAQTLW